MPRRVINESGDEYEYESYSEEDEYSEEPSNRGSEDSSFSESSITMSENSSDDESIISEIEHARSTFSVINSDMTRLLSELFN